jgi:hypothetical protein
MSTDRDVTGIVRSWLDEGVTALPDRVLDAVLDRIPATPQRRAWWPVRRFLTLNATFRYGIAAIVVAVAAIVGFSLINTQVGDDEPTPTPTPASSVEAGAALPAELQHSFLGEIRDATLTAGGDRSILTFTDRTFTFATGVRDVFASDASVVDSSTLILVAQNASDSCETGAVGRYEFSLSPGGSILTISDGTDACAERAQALPGDWQRSVCLNPDNLCLGNLEAGIYSSQFIEPRPIGGWQARYGALTYTVPDGWAASGDWPETYSLMKQADYATYDPEACSECADQIVVYVNPFAASLDNCAEAAATGVDDTVDGLVAWLSRHPGLVVSEPQPISIGGLDGSVVDLEMASDWTGTCPAAIDPWIAAPIFFNGYHLAIGADDRQRFVLLDLGDGNTVGIQVDSRDTADFDSFVAEAMPIVETFSFPPA